jgi:hypothetical protein
MRIPNLAFASLLILLPLPMMADIYTYTGPNFNYVELVSSAYTTSDSITGSFTMAGSLGLNQALEDAPFLTYSFSDGVQTFTNPNPTDDGFKVATDANGTIDQWFLSFAIPLSDQLFPDADKFPANTIFDMQSSSLTGPAGQDNEFLFIPAPIGRTSCLTSANCASFRIKARSSSLANFEPLSARDATKVLRSRTSSCRGRIAMPRQ